MNVDGLNLNLVVNRSTVVPGTADDHFYQFYGSQERVGNGRVVMVGTDDRTCAYHSGIGLYSVPTSGGAVTLLANTSTTVNGIQIGAPNIPQFPFDFQVGRNGQVVFQVSQQIYTVPALGGTVGCVAASGSPPAHKAPCQTNPSYKPSPTGNTNATIFDPRIVAATW